MYDFKSMFFPFSTSVLPPLDYGRTSPAYFSAKLLTGCTVLFIKLLISFIKSLSPFYMYC